MRKLCCSQTKLFINVVMGGGGGGGHYGCLPPNGRGKSILLKNCPRGAQNGSKVRTFCGQDGTATYICIAHVCDGLGTLCKLSAGQRAKTTCPPGRNPTLKLYILVSMNITDVLIHCLDSSTHAL